MATGRSVMTPEEARMRQTDEIMIRCSRDLWGWLGRDREVAA